MELKVGVLDRLLILQSEDCIPKKGTYESIQCGKSIESKMSFSAEEIENIQLKTNFYNKNGELLEKFEEGCTPLLQWNTAKEELKSVTFTEGEKKLIVSWLEKMNKEETIQREHAFLYENFIGNHG